jgi:Family of unknown function (DUF5808)
MSKKNRGVKPLNVVLGTAAVTLMGSAIVQQLSRPASERTWYGKIAGVPYDFRVPTPEKLRDTFWNKNTSQVLVPHAFGMGWTVNFYPIVHPKPVDALPENKAE